MTQTNGGYGAVIERGIIMQEDKGAYIVQSLSRDNVTTLPITDSGEYTYQVGDMVYFFMFDDGTGKIISPL